VLAADAESDEPRGDSAKERHTFEQAENERHLVELRLANHERRQDAVVDGLLHPLGDPGGK
jgi:hypothetical protein